MATAELLATCWHRWADDLADLLDAHWRLPTRCGGWDVAALASHLAPDAYVRAAKEPVDGPAAVDDAVLLLRGFNEPGGIAHEEADEVAEDARRLTETRELGELGPRFRDAAEWLLSSGPDPDTVVPHSVVGSVTTQVLLDVGLIEAVVHHQDLRHAIARPPMPDEAVDEAVAILARIADPQVFIDAATGRIPSSRALPVMR